MRWESLFADMEGQLEAANAADLLAGVPDLTTAERATVTLAGRLRAARTGTVVVRVRDGELVTGTVVDVADQWVLLGAGSRRALVPLAAVTGVRGVEPASHPDTGTVARRLGLGHALRALARDRAPVRVVTLGGESSGRIDRVGADHVDLTAVSPDGAGRSVAGRSVAGQGDAGQGSAAATSWVIPFAAIDVVHSG